MIKYLKKILPLNFKLLLKAILNIETEFNNLDLKRLPKNYKIFKGKVYYIIFIHNKGHGFFSNFYHVLFHISIADFYNWIPVVDMQNYTKKKNEKKNFYSRITHGIIILIKKKNYPKLILKKIKLF